ncbi:MAG: Holliday junction DNA helicase RuvA [Legionellales bacterium RIFCSPHIGHO2_12_FULL_35_11]|nr:MAG: Holliday junction DNA helicase RuvA [Legionellales bacterium RIFCSPHIGHO2_12_FULL_35_11]
MIGWLRGKIIEKEQPGKVILDVGGVGYDVETSLITFFNIESKSELISLYIHTVVREDAFLLYGFIDKNERSLFRALIKVNGVGPKLAIAILSSILPAEFISCIQGQNVELLTKLPGIGKKTASRLVVEMKDSINNLSAAGINYSPSKPQNTNIDEAISALESLGFKKQEATKVIEKISDGSQTSEELIREALRSIRVC